MLKKTILTLAIVNLSLNSGASFAQTSNQVPPHTQNGQSAKQTGSKLDKTSKISTQFKKESLNLDWRDTKVSPADDFYTYANGGWQKQNPVPPDYARWGIFSMLQEKVLEDLHTILKTAQNDTTALKDSITQKVGDFYYSGMDEQTINKLKFTPLKEQFQTIANIKDIKDLQAAITKLQQIGVNAPFAFTSMQDFKDSQRMIGVAVQSGLGLPDRDYYLKTEAHFQNIRKEYENHIMRMFELLGESATNAKKYAQTVMRIETSLATDSMSKIEQRDPYKIYNMMNLHTLKKVTPTISWKQYFNDINQPQIREFNLAMPHFFIELDKKFKSTSIDDWKIYLQWHLINTFAPFLSDDFVNEHFHMNKVITGTEQILPRYKRVINAENQAIGFLVGKMYVDKHFPPLSKQKVLEITHDIRQALSTDLKDLSWMSEKTKQAALKKLNLMEERIGYPEKWLDYSKLKITRNSYIENIINSNKFLIARELEKIDKPVDRDEWEMTPQTVNAYYHPTMNNINFPAGILLPPFFDPDAPAAVNYGGIGSVIGHEITHGFDDEGGQFDGHGNLNRWWTKEDYKKFQQATKCISDQFSAYTVADNIHVQGKLVSGEATADLGGLILAYNAYVNSKHFKDAPTIDGVTPLQQFFLSAAHSWAGNIRPEEAKRLVLVDPHPPMIYRVNGTVSNMPQFQQAFNIPDNSPMVNVKRCVIW